MTTPTASGPEGTPVGPQEGSKELDSTTEKTAKVAESHFSKVKDETVHILSVLEQYNFSTKSKAAFRDLSKYLSRPGDSIELNQFNELSTTARGNLSDEIDLLGRKSLDDFKPVGSDFNSAKFTDSVVEWEKSVGSLKRALIESELSTLPNSVLLFRVISPREAEHIRISRKAKAEQREVSEKEFSVISEVSDSNEIPEISDDCIRMGTVCRISPGDSQLNSSDFILELETASASKYRGIFGNPEGHNPQDKPESLSVSIADRVMTTLSYLGHIPEMKENETVFSFSFPTLIIRAKNADSSMMSFPLVHNKYPGSMGALMSGSDDNLGDRCEGCKKGTHTDDSTRPYECFNIQAQYADIKRQCDDVHAAIVGKCDVVQRVVHRGGDLVFEKGIRGSALTELMRVPVAKLKKRNDN